jgi:hypothetical protein
MRFKNGAVANLNFLKYFDEIDYSNPLLKMRLNKKEKIVKLSELDQKKFKYFIFNFH